MESFVNTTGYYNMNNEVIYSPKIEEFNVILSDDGKKIFELVNFVSFCGSVALFGITANIINIIIFYKQGFANTVNIAFLGLAVSDMCCLCALLWASICINPFLPVYDITWVSVEVMYLTAGWPYVCFCRITSYITVYITAERFISIALPLQVKQIFTVKRTTMIICLIYVVNIMTFISEYATSYLDWQYFPKKNRTLMAIIFTKSREDVQGLCYVLHALFSATSFVAVIIFTLALVLKLRRTSEWRRVTASSLQTITNSKKERKTVKMVVLIACILIICYTPGAILSLITFVIGSELDIKGRYVNICDAAWSTVFCFQSVNSSVNIFLYYRMSSKYRETFNNIAFKYFRLLMRKMRNN